MLNQVRKAVEGPKRGVPYSSKKVEVRKRVLYWKAGINRVKGGSIDISLINKRRQDLNIDECEIILDKLK